MKVLLVTAEPECAPLNGLGKFVWEFAREFGKSAEVKIFSLQMDPFVISPEQLPPADPAYKADYSFRSEYDWYTENLEARHMLAAHNAFPVVKSILAEFGPDIIYLQGPKVWFPFRNEKNTIMAFHGFVKDIVDVDIPNVLWIAQEKWEVEAASRARAVVVFSSFMKDRWSLLYTRLHPFHVISLGIDVGSYRQEKKPEEFHIAFFGRLVDAHKRYRAFLEGVQDLPSSTGDGRAVSFHVWGKGEMIDESEFPSVIFHGHVSGDELITAFAETDVVVVPSAYEPFGYVALEALASGCVVLATSGQGMDAFLEPGKNCVRITPDAFSIHEELLKIIDSPGQYTAFANEGLQTACSWSWERSVREHVDFFLNLTKESK